VRCKPCDEFRLGVGPVAGLAREPFSSDADHRGAVRAHGAVGERSCCRAPPERLVCQRSGRVPWLVPLMTQTLLSWAGPWLGAYIPKPGKPLPACFPSSRQRRAANGKKFALKIMTTVCTSLLRCSQNFSGVHIVSPVFTSFLSPLDYTCVSKGIYTHASTLGHITMPLHATHHR
jgi:hypothetical protein